MTPAQAIAMLDRQIAQHGQTVKLVRLVPNGTAIEATVKGFVRGYRPDELAGGIQQGDSSIVLSPTQLAATAFASAPVRANDKAETNGRRRNVQMADPVYINDVLVRINLQVRG